MAEGKERQSKWWLQWRVESALFAAVFLVGGLQRPPLLEAERGAAIVYQAQSWLEGRLDVDPQVLPNLEDWACVRKVDGELRRCTRPLQSGDRWYSSFPAFPSLVMLPFVALHHLQFNDTSFGVAVAALAVALLTLGLFGR